MKRLFAALVWLPVLAAAHPGIGIVADSKGSVFFTDLHPVWKISGKRQTVAVPNVHTHELYIDNRDNVYGEHQWNDESGTHFYHYLWRLSPDGRLDTVIGNRPAFAAADFSLARDTRGNEYYLKPRHYLKAGDTSHIIRRNPSGQETILATSLFKGVSWLHPHGDGSVLYILNNTVYKVGADAVTRTVARNIAGEKPSYTYFGTKPVVYGAWQDAAQNVYVAAFSDQCVKKIDTAGVVSVFYKSTGEWAPTHGVFDRAGQLWVLECSDKNEIRAVRAETPKVGGVQHKNEAPKKQTSRFLLGWAALGVIGLLLAYFGLRLGKQRAVK